MNLVFAVFLLVMASANLALAIYNWQNQNDMDRELEELDQQITRLRRKAGLEDD